VKEKTITILFHVGRGKTATTFLQKHACKIPNCLYLGKYYNHNFNFLGNLNDIHYRLFPSYRRELNCYPNPTVNSFSMTNKYVNSMVEEWKKLSLNKKEPIDKILLSDECIQDYANYLAELNTALLGVIGKLLEENISRLALELFNYKINFKKVLTITIREQSSITISAWGYSAASNSLGFKESLKYFLKKPKESFQGGLWYSESLSMSKKLLSYDWKIKMIPYELLLQTKGGEIFFFEVFAELIDDNERQLIQIDNRKINANRSNKSLPQKRRAPYLWKFFWKNNLTSYSNYKSCKGKKYLKLIIFGTTFVFTRVMLKWYSRLWPNQLSAKEFTPDYNMLSEIKKMYRDDNIKLQKMIPQYNLKEFGYLE
jgi:hypothetical protein